MTPFNAGQRAAQQAAQQAAQNAQRLAAQQAAQNAQRSAQLAAHQSAQNAQWNAQLTAQRARYAGGQTRRSRGIAWRILLTAILGYVAINIRAIAGFVGPFQVVVLVGVMLALILLWRNVGSSSSA
jgi:hypothetical protein